MGFQEFIEHSILEYNNFKLTPGAIGAILLLFITIKTAIFLLRKTLLRLFRRKNFEVARAESLVVIAKYFLWTIYILLCIKILGLDITWLIASSAALMVGVGLGLQNVFNDFISGIILLFEGTVDPGDIITVDGMVGKVKNVGIRTSQIITRNNITILVPNHKLTEDNVINWSHMHDAPRYYVTVGVAYGTDTELVNKILLDCAKNHPKVSSKYEPFTRFINFGTSSLDFELYFWSEEIFLIQDVESDLRLEIDKAFREHGVVVPFPQQDIHFKTTDINLNKL
jgi:small-conductance mechanosensitive channel